MAIKRLGIRLGEALVDQLKIRATLERRSTSDIIGEAIQDYLQSHPVPREHMLQMVRAIAKEDAALLKALADA